MNPALDEGKLVQYIADRSKIGTGAIRIVLKHEQAFMDQAQRGSSREIEIDGDELVDYIMRQRDVKLQEPDVDAILDLEMKYLLDHGLADYDD